MPEDSIRLQQLRQEKIESTHKGLFEIPSRGRFTYPFILDCLKRSKTSCSTLRFWSKGKSRAMALTDILHDLTLTVNCIAKMSQSSEHFLPVFQLLITINLDFHMDPLLAEVCHDDLMKHCSEEVAFSKRDSDNADGAPLECLRRHVALNKVKNDSCVLEVLRLVIASKSDIDVDPSLARDCASSLETICGMVSVQRAGHGFGRQMKCLVDAVDADDSRLDTTCRRSLELRRELWQIAAKRLDWSSLIHEINNSHHRGLIIGIVFTFLGAIFVIGLCCGRCSKRTFRINMKNR